MFIQSRANLYRALCLHAAASSDLLLRQSGSSACRPMATFSARQSSQFLYPGWYAPTSFSISHLIGGSGLSLFSHTYVNRAVAFLFFSDLKLFLCAARASLSLSVPPLNFMPSFVLLEQSKLLPTPCNYESYLSLD